MIPAQWRILAQQKIPVLLRIPTWMINFLKLLFSETILKEPVIKNGFSKSQQFYKRSPCILEGTGKIEKHIHFSSDSNAQID